MRSILIFIKEFQGSFFMWNFWFVYGNQDIKNKYSRSVIGPWWITIAIMVTVFAMGPLYANILNIGGDNMGEYLMHLSTGLVFWFYISGTLIDASTAFINNEGFAKTTNYPIFVYILRCVYRNFLALAHNLVLVMILYPFYGNPSINILWFIPILFLVTFFLILCSFVIGIFSTRYRDIIPLVSTTLQLSMFLTPVFWMPTINLEKSKFLLFNPFNYILKTLRAPFYNNFIISDYVLLFLGVLVVFIFVFVLYKNYRKVIVYWI